VGQYDQTASYRITEKAGFTDVSKRNSFASFGDALGEPSIFWRAYKVTKKEAMAVIDQALASLRLTRREHDILMQALKILGADS